MRQQQSGLDDLLVDNGAEKAGSSESSARTRPSVTRPPGIMQQPDERPLVLDFLLKRARERGPKGAERDTFVDEPRLYRSAKLIRGRRVTQFVGHSSNPFRIGAA